MYVSFFHRKEKLEQLRRLRKKLKKSYKNLPEDLISVGDFTYGKINYKSWGDTKLTIGNFCSIAEDVTFMLGGNHRTDWISLYPFNAFMSCFSFIRDETVSKGDIVVGNDVWIGTGALIMSGVKLEMELL